MSLALFGGALTTFPCTSGLQIFLRPAGGTCTRCTPPPGYAYTVTTNVNYLDSFPAGCRVGTTMLSAEMLVSWGAGSPVALDVRDDLVIGA